MGRRDVLRLVGPGVAMAGLAGTSGCLEAPRERVLPYTDQPPELTPGVPQYFATSLVVDGFAIGLLAESREGRPTKLEGNPDHPASLGATDTLSQASVLGLYDPDRTRGVTRGLHASSWKRFEEAVALRPDQRGLWFLLQPQSSPHIHALIARVRERHPSARFAFWSPVSRERAYRASEIVFGKPFEVQYDFSAARTVLSLDADFMSTLPMSVRYARDFARRRRLGSPDAETSRLYAVEPMPSPTGTLADHRLAVPSAEVARVAAGILAEVLAASTGDRSAPPEIRTLLRDGAPAAHQHWIRLVARDLLASRGDALVIAGPTQSVETHVLAHLLNDALGSLGATASLTEPALVEPLGGATLVELAEAIQQRQVQTLVLAETNPVYAAPPELDLARLIREVPLTVHYGLYRDESARACEWSLPAAHYLESWGDARAYDGTISTIQPLIEPLYAGRNLAQLLAMFGGSREPSMYDLLRQSWDERHPDATGSLEWERAIQRGFEADTALPVRSPELRWEGARDVLEKLGAAAPASLELNVEVCPKVYDGRFANNAWLQELPHPLTKLTWGNAAILGPELAASLGIERGDELRLKVGPREVVAPAMILPGHAEGAISLAMGYGRAGAESAADGLGVNAFELVPADGSLSARGLIIAPTGRKVSLPITQDHGFDHDRPIALNLTLMAYRENPRFAAHHKGEQPSLLPPIRYEGTQWAMTIDTMICNGCSTCVVACQAENNVPVVGPEGVRSGREMHWLRIDRYFEGPLSDPQIIHQPMLCQHCELAPCEYVCPVNATVHSPDGLNEMVYNRCVGTRFCSNNCPYKVRRFNWFRYDVPPPTGMQKNPDVTVRERGVMEKCTYCVQRIRRAEIVARRGRSDFAKHDVPAVEVVTACQQACPTGAIQFGTLSNPDSEMVKWREQPRAYDVFHSLGTRPRTRYLAKITNPNPELGQ